MKALHAGLLAVGAALAGGLAVWMTMPPPLPVAVPAPQASVSTAPAPPPAEPPPQPAPAQSAPSIAPTIATAPPPVYSEPPHAEKQPSVTRSMPTPYVKPSPAPKPAPVVVAAVPYQEPTPRKAPDPAPAPEAKAPPEPPSRQVSLDRGQEISVRVLQSLSADNAQAGDVFHGELAAPLIANGLVVGERGAPVKGRVVEVQKGRFFGAGSTISLRLLNFLTADGQHIEVSTEPWSVNKVVGNTVIRFRVAARITITERRL